MRRAACFVCVALFGICSSASALAQDYTPIAGWDRQLFPSYLVATATVRLPAEDEVNDEDEPDVYVLGDRQGVLGIEITAPSAGSVVTVTVMGNSILEESTFEGTLDEEEGVYR